MVNAKVILYKILKIYILIILITQHFSQYECSSGKKTCFVSKAVGYIHTYIHYEARPPTIVTRVIILSSWCENALWLNKRFDCVFNHLGISFLDLLKAASPVTHYIFSSDPPLEETMWNILTLNHINHLGHLQSTFPLRSSQLLYSVSHVIILCPWRSHQHTPEPFATPEYRAQ